MILSLYLALQVSLSVHRACVTISSFSLMISRGFTWSCSGKGLQDSHEVLHHGGEAFGRAGESFFTFAFI